jgi:ascorbate-specific PTS system EIIC-type component UlaA
MKKYLSITTLLLFIPTITLGANQAFAGLVNKLVDIINIIVPILVSLAIVLFFYHTSKGIFGNAKDGVDARKNLKDTLFWGVIIIFVMVSIWGILSLIGGEFDLLQPSFLK